MIISLITEWHVGSDTGCDTKNKSTKYIKILSSGSILNNKPVSMIFSVNLF